MDLLLKSIDFTVVLKRCYETSRCIELAKNTHHITGYTPRTNSFLSFLDTSPMLLTIAAHAKSPAASPRPEPVEASEEADLAGPPPPPCHPVTPSSLPGPTRRAPCPGPRCFNDRAPSPAPTPSHAQPTLLGAYR